MCRAKEVKDSFANLRQLVLIEEFLNKCFHDVRIFVTERQVSTFTEAAK